MLLRMVSESKIFFLREGLQTPLFMFNFQSLYSFFSTLKKYPIVKYGKIWSAP